jgi:Tol biopolymer transport system component
MIGQEVSHYKIIDKLFESDLAVVYRAEDTRHNRPVAFLLLPKAVAINRKAMERFEACVATASSIQHPNICDVYDIGNHEDHPFIVMELLEGQTIGRRIGEKGLRIEEILDLGSQVVEGLEAAHARNVLFRNITPQSIFITRHGTAKLLDLELARLLEERPPPESRGTAPGVAAADFPSAAYMSPEQVRGEQLDVRSDIFAVGAILYQMATGARLFEGSRYDEIVEEVLQKPFKTPARQERAFRSGFWHVVAKALEKEKDLRYQTAGEMLRDLHRLIRDRSPEEETSSPAAGIRVLRRASRRRWVKTAALLAVLLLPLGWLAVRWFRSPVRITHLVSLPGHKDHPRFSPDGKQVAFEWDGEDGSNRDIYIKRSGSGTPFRLTSDPGDDELPVWSPDGRQIAFVRESGGGATIYTVPSGGGPEERIIRLNGPVYDLDEFIPALTWSHDGKWLAFSEKSAENGPVRVMLLSMGTRVARPLTYPPSEYDGDFWPEFSPDGRSIAFVRKVRFGVNDVWTQIMSSGKASRLTFKNYLSCEGPDWTPDGQGVVYSAAVVGDYPRIWRAWISGNAPEPLEALGENVGPPSISRNRVVYAQAYGRGISIWRLPAAQTPGPERSPALLIASNSDDTSPRYSPDGARIAFESTRSGSNQIWTCASDGSGQVQLTNMGGYCGAASWSPDGRLIAFDSTSSGNREIWVVDSRGGTPHRMTDDASQDAAPSFSRDGKWVYFSSDRSGKFQIWKMPSQGGKAVQVTTGGGFYAVESHDSSFLCYSQRNRSGIWKVPARGGEESRILNRQVNWTDWSLSREGIFYLAHRQRRVGEAFAVGYLQFGTGKINEVYQQESLCLHGWLSVSPDDRWILYGEVPRWEVDLMLAENLRLKNPAGLGFPALLLGMRSPR